MKSPLRALMLFPLCALSVACGEDVTLCAAFDSNMALVDSQGTARTSFPQGAPVKLAVTVTNTRGNAQTLTIFDGCAEVTGSVGKMSGELFWHSEENRVCTMATVPTTYRGGESRAFTYTWDQRDPQDAQVPPGTYVAQMEQRTECGALLSKTIEFAIE